MSIHRGQPYPTEKHVVAGFSRGVPPPPATSPHNLVCAADRQLTAHALSLSKISGYNQGMKASWLERLRRDIPYPVVLTAAWSLCAMIIVAGGWVAANAIGRLRIVIIPLAIALLLAAMLAPVVRMLRQRAHLPGAAAALIAEFGLIAIVATGFITAGTQFALGMNNLWKSAAEGLDQFNQWLVDGPLHTDPVNFNFFDSVPSSATSNLASSALLVGATTADLLAGAFICLIALFFFLLQGESIWRFLLNFAPKDNRQKVHEAMRRGWVSLGAYARMQLGVAAINAVGIGLGALVLKLPLVIPITVVVFLCSFVPIVGALVSGVFAVLIAFVDGGLWMAVIMTIVVIVVHFVEAHLLQPFLMGHAVSVHPLGVIVVVAAGTYLFKLPGALFAVPLTALLNSAVRYTVGNDPFPQLGTQPVENLGTRKPTIKVHTRPMKFPGPEGEPEDPAPSNTER